MKLCTKEILSIIAQYPDLDETTKKTTKEIIKFPEIVKEKKKEKNLNDSPKEKLIIKGDESQKIEEKSERDEKDERIQEENKKKDELEHKSNDFEAKNEEIEQINEEIQQNNEELKKYLLRKSEIKALISDLEKEMIDLAEVFSLFILCFISKMFKILLN